MNRKIRHLLRQSRQSLERFGRKWLISTLSHLLQVRKKAVCIPYQAPKILVIRLDRRLGNVLLSTPVLSSLRARFPTATVDILVDARGQNVLQTHPAVNTVWAYRKAALWHAYGPLRTILRLRRQRYDVCLDLGNPTDPSATQAIMTRFSGATHTVGVQRPYFSRLFTCSVKIPETTTHEIDKRLTLLQALPGQKLCRTLSLGLLPLPHNSKVPAFVERVLQSDYAVLNLGARLQSKQLDTNVYARIATLIHKMGLTTLLTWGPCESHLARQVAQLAAGVQIAPATNVAELAYLMRSARFVISCDTGPMHLAVALQRPTCAIFVSTPSARFGYNTQTHCSITFDDKAPQNLLAQIEAFIRQKKSPLNSVANMTDHDPTRSF